MKQQGLSCHVQWQFLDSAALVSEKGEERRGLVVEDDLPFFSFHFFHEVTESCLHWMDLLLTEVNR